MTGFFTGLIIGLILGAVGMYIYWLLWGDM